MTGAVFLRGTIDAPAGRRLRGHAGWPRRGVAFGCVGALGIGVQLAALTGLTAATKIGLGPATALAVEAAILHNFVWHDRWTWGDRRRAGGGWWRRLLWFNIVGGALAIPGNVLLTGLYATWLDIPGVGANVLAIASLSVMGYVTNDRFVFETRG